MSFPCPTDICVRFYARWFNTDSDVVAEKLAEQKITIEVQMHPPNVSIRLPNG